MLKYALIGALLVVVTVMIHGVGTLSLARFVRRRYIDENGLVPLKKCLRILVGVVLAMLVVHSIEIILWAFAYSLILPMGELGSFEETVYFSFVTFTTLGYGDITLTEGWRLLSGIEAMNGIMLAGWTTAMLFTVVERVWRSILVVRPKGVLG
jgi:hypothetical protein